MHWRQLSIQVPWPLPPHSSDGIFSLPFSWKSVAHQLTFSSFVSTINNLFLPFNGNVITAFSVLYLYLLKFLLHVFPFLSWALFFVSPKRHCGNAAFENWFAGEMRFVRNASSKRSDCPVHVRLLSVTHSETFGLLNWSRALHIRYIFVACTFQPFHVRCMYLRKAPVTLDRIEPPNVKRIRIFVIRWCS